MKIIDKWVFSIGLLGMMMAVGLIAGNNFGITAALCGIAGTVCLALSIKEDKEK